MPQGKPVKKYRLVKIHMVFSEFLEILVYLLS